jgi:hypothetical protein
VEAVNRNISSIEVTALVTTLSAGLSQVTRNGIEKAVSHGTNGVANNFAHYFDGMRGMRGRSWSRVMLKVRRYLR